MDKIEQLTEAIEEERFSRISEDKTKTLFLIDYNTNTYILLLILKELKEIKNPFQLLTSKMVKKEKNATFQIIYDIQQEDVSR